MIVNPCNAALRNDQTMIDRGLTSVTYTDDTCKDDATIEAEISSLQVWSKLMLQNYNDPHQVKQQDGVQRETYFSARSKQGLYSHETNNYVLSLSRNSIFYNNRAWQNFPIVSWFYNPEEEDLVTFEVH